MIDPLKGASLGDATVIIVACQYTQPPKHQPGPIDLAALFLRRADGAWSRTGDFESLIRPPEHAAITAPEVLATGINPLMLVSKPAAAQVLGRLDGLLNTPPYVLVSYNARMLARVLYQYREHCPRLAQTYVINTHELARKLIPELPGHHLEAVLRHLELPARAEPHRAAPDVEAGVGVFEYLADLADSAWGNGALRQLRRMAGITPQATIPVQESMF